MAKKKPGKKPAPAVKTALVPAAPPALLEDLRALIRQAGAVNSALVLLSWEIGQRIRTEILKEQRAAYGEEIVATVSRQLTAEWPWPRREEPAADRPVRRLFPDRQIVAALSRQLSWGRFVKIIPLDDPLKREFYAGSGRVGPGGALERPRRTAEA